jgi:hypothetical protein
MPKLIHVVIGIAFTAIAAFRNSPVFGIYLVYKRFDGLCVEVNVGNGREKPADHKVISAFVGFRVVLGRPGKAYHRTGQDILELGDFGRFSAYTGFSGTALTGGGLLTLKTKHLVFHNKISF